MGKRQSDWTEMAPATAGRAAVQAGAHIASAGYLQDERQEAGAADVWRLAARVRVLGT